jgi:hypothetical protein
MKWDVALLWRGFITAVVLAAIFGTAGSILGGVWWLSLGFVALGAGWWYSNRQQRINEMIELHENIAFALFLAALAYGGYKGAPPALLLLGGVAVLAAWDLDGFYRQLSAATLIMGEELLVKAHMQQLALVVGLSLVIGMAALLMQIHLTFGIAVLLALLAIWGLGLVVGQIVKWEGLGRGDWRLGVKADS